ncbi:PTS transporter subunit EIIC [Agrilactobacillus fermenti]|uniref:PTS transporter subunit EIIC n=1 Tax=Agrilactobacillus fermenti TaxID=2586909 RepID=UPI003A5BC9AD
MHALLIRLTRTSFKLNKWIRKFRIYAAIRQTFSILFPFVVIGSFFRALNLAVFRPDGFFATVWHIEDWLPYYTQIAKPIAAITTLTINVIALLAVFLVAKYLAHALKDDDHIVGICGLLTLLILNFNFNALSHSLDHQNGSDTLPFNNFGFRDLFFSLLIGILVAYFYHVLAAFSKRHLPHKNIDQSFTTRGIHAIFPVSVLLITFVLLSFGISFTPQHNLSTLFYGLLEIPLSTRNHVTLFLFFITLINTLLGFLGISGPLNFMTQNIANPAGAANLSHALSTKNLFTVPNPVTLHTLYDTYGNFGGSGMTLGLILVILFLIKNHGLRQVAAFSFLPSLVNINDPIMLGIPIIFNPLLLIPYTISPLVSMAIAWLFINVHWMPPAVYAVPGTTPGILLGFLGTNGNYMALLVSILGLFTSAMIYYPFIRIIAQINTHESFAKSKVTTHA